MKTNKKLIGVAALIGSGAIAGAVAYLKKKQDKKAKKEEDFEDTYRVLETLSTITGTALIIQQEEKAFNNTLFVVDMATTEYLHELALLPEDYVVGFEESVPDKIEPGECNPPIKHARLRK